VPSSGGNPNSICGTWIDLPKLTGGVRTNRFCVVRVSRNSCSFKKTTQSGGVEGAEKKTKKLCELRASVVNTLPQ